MFDGLVKNTLASIGISVIASLSACSNSFDLNLGKGNKIANNRYD